MRKLSTLLLTLALSMIVPIALAQDTAGCHGRKTPEGKPATKTKQKKVGKKVSPEE